MAEIIERVVNLEKTLEVFVKTTQEAISSLSMEMKEFKAEMREFKEEMRQDKKDLNKKWGELSNKLGSLAEDIAAPGLQGVIQRHFNKEPDRRMDTMWIRNVKDKHDVREFDVIAVTDEYFFIAEIKYTPRNEYVKDFVKLVTTGKVYDYWPEYQDKILVPVFSSLSLPANVVKYLTKYKVLAMAMGEDHMEIVNQKVLKKWL